MENCDPMVRCSAMASLQETNITVSNGTIEYSLWRPLRVGIVGGLGVQPPSSQFMSTDAHFWVKIGFKFQFLGKISNISTSDPPALLGQFQHCNTLLTKSGPRCTSRDMSNLEWPRHISPTGHPIHFIFGSRSGFSGSMDRMALFPVRSNPKWRPWHEMTWHDRRYRQEPSDIAFC